MNTPFTNEEAHALIVKIYAADEAMNAKAFVELLAPDAVFQLGGSPSINGRESIQKFVHGLFMSLKGLRHRLIDFWVGNGKLVFQGEATFTFLNGQSLVLPYVDVITPGSDGTLADYRIFIDLTPLAAGASSSKT